VAVSAIEHPSVLESAPHAIRLRVDANGIIDFNVLEDVLKANPKPALISLMLVNNETGVINPVQEVAVLAKKHGALVHCDAVQALGRIPVNFAELGVDYLSLSAHKIGGPQGVGAIIMREKAPFIPLLVGGGQEMRRRAGTENVAGAVGFAVATNTLAEDLIRVSEWTAWRDAFETAIMVRAPEVVIFSKNAPRAGNISCLAMPQVKNETQLMAFDLAGFAVSSGSACSSGKVQASHVLKAMGVDDAVATSAIRVSFGWGSAKEDLTGFAKVWLDFYERHKK
jgi:cysteine desulfurase